MRHFAKAGGRDAPRMVRPWAGLKEIDDILRDLDRALAAAAEQPGYRLRCPVDLTTGWFRMIEFE